MVNGQNSSFLSELLPLFLLKKCFSSLFFSLLFMISESNFTDVFHIKGYIL